MTGKRVMWLLLRSRQGVAAFGQPVNLQSSSAGARDRHETKVDILIADRELMRRLVYRNVREWRYGVFRAPPAGRTPDRAVATMRSTP